MLTVKVVSEKSGIALYSAEKIHYRHMSANLSQYYLEVESQVLVQTGGHFTYHGVSKEPNPNAHYDFLELVLDDSLDSVSLIFSKSTVYVMNENGKTVETIHI